MFRKWKRAGALMGASALVAAVGATGPAHAKVRWTDCRSQYDLQVFTRHGTFCLTGDRGSQRNVYEAGLSLKDATFIWSGRWAGAASVWRQNDGMRFVVPIVPGKGVAVTPAPTTASSTYVEKLVFSAS
ncbi:hypothetical protein AB0P21_40875 [Kribbella sp. NPDC056861]|uniref:hypothetical protein n=1 Tax=Kribbella sp. NPDC056861 TaxID=3154857 RepID=UPI00343FF718